ncbi:DUF2341 domain-containing protein [Methanocaldococcus sp.]
MYISQNAIILVMLVFVISSIFYLAINYKTKEVEDEIEVKKVALFEHNLINSLDRNINKIVEDAFVNTSYKIMTEHKFFDNSSDAVNYIKSYIKNETNRTLSCLIDNSSNLSFNITTVNIYPTNNPKVINLIMTININLIKKINNGEIFCSKPLTINKNITLFRIPDPYVYLNNFYYTWSYEKDINIYNFPNDNKSHTFCIILNDSNFNYSQMVNPYSPTEIRIIGNNNVLLPYWVQIWYYGNNHVSIIWVRCNKSQIINYVNNSGYIRLLYGSNTTVDRQNPDKTFLLFDNFSILNSSKWNISGNVSVNNGILTVVGTNSGIHSYKSFGTGYELVFRGNFSNVGTQAVGFFNDTSYNSGVDWAYTINALYMIINNNRYYVNGYNNYLNNYFIYIIQRNPLNTTFKIDNDTLNQLYTNTIYGINSNNYSVSVITLYNNNAKVSIDWVFVKDINNIKTTVSSNVITNPNYKEEKPKTYNRTIYYGEPKLYIFVQNGSYSIIGLYTNATDSWGNVGYEPIVAIN